MLRRRRVYEETSVTARLSPSGEPRGVEGSERRLGLRGILIERERFGARHDKTLVTVLLRESGHAVSE